MDVLSTLATLGAQLVMIKFIHTTCRKGLCDSCHRRLAAKVNMKTRCITTFICKQLLAMFYHLHIHSELQCS